METNNPVLSNLPDAEPIASDRLLTQDEIVQKTGITLAVIIGFAILNAFLAMSGQQSLAMILTIVGAIGGFIAVLVSAFSKNGYSSKTITLTYAGFEGLFVGGLSLILSGYMVGAADAGVLVGQAVIATVGVFLGMLWLYKSGRFQVTPKFNKVMLMLLCGTLFAVLINLVTAIFFGINVLRDGGPIAIVFSLFCIVLAALSFMADFDTADRLVQSGAPKEMAWGVALGLAVTLVWLYTEILRLLRYFRD